MQRGHLLIIAAAVLWSTGGFFAKAPTFADWPTEIRLPQKIVSDEIHY